MTTHTTLKTIMASLVAVTIASTALTAPAAAGGSISFTVKPKNQDEENALKAGLLIYKVVTLAKDGQIKQNGVNNIAGLAQLGTGNFGVVHQEGNGHNGTLVQNGNDNAYGLFQFGKNTDNHVVQNGNGEAGATFSFGW